MCLCLEKNEFKNINLHTELFKDFYRNRPFFFIFDNYLNDLMNFRE